MDKQIKICMGSSCFARGNSENLEIIEKYIKEHNLKANVEILGARCNNICAKGPTIFVDNKEYNAVDKEKLDKILEGLNT